MQIATKDNRNFGLSQEEFDALAEKLTCGDEALFETIFLNHFDTCMSRLRSYTVTREQAYDSVMWAMLRMRQMLLEQKVAYGNLESYVVRMAVNHYLKKQTRSKEIPMEVLPEVATETEPIFDEDMLGILEKAWAQMGEKCQLLLKGFYYDKIELKHLTVLLDDSSEANTRKRKERCINGLRKLFFESY